MCLVSYLSPPWNLSVWGQRSRSSSLHSHCSVLHCISWFPSDSLPSLKMAPKQKQIVLPLMGSLQSLHLQLLDFVLTWASAHTQNSELDADFQSWGLLSLSFPTFQQGWGNPCLSPYWPLSITRWSYSVNCFKMNILPSFILPLEIYQWLSR